MKRILSLIVTVSAIILSASTYEKTEPSDYHDSIGNKIKLLVG